MRVDALDAALLIALVGWVAAAGVAVIGRARRGRRRHRVADLARELRRFSSSSAPDTLERIRQRGRRLTPVEFQELVRRGIEPDVAATVAQAVIARAGNARMRRIADGRADADVWTRIAALQVLVSAGDPHRHAALDECLRSGSRLLAASAIRLLTRLDDPPAALVLAAALRDRVYAPSRLAAALDRMMVPRAGLLGPLLGAREADVRFWGVRLAGRIAAAEWAPAVRELIGDEDPLVRRAAVETLALIGDASDRPRLLARFADEAAMVRAHAARASVAFANEAVADTLTELLADREWIVRAAAREALQRLRGLGTAAVVRTLWHPDPFAANSAAEVLHRTGAAAEAARRAVHGAAASADLLAILGRFIAMGGAQLRDALLGVLEEPDRRLLLARVGDASRSE